MTNEAILMVKMLSEYRLQASAPICSAPTSTNSGGFYRQASFADFEARSAKWRPEKR